VAGELGVDERAARHDRLTGIAADHAADLADRATLAVAGGAAVGLGEQIDVGIGELWMGGERCDPRIERRRVLEVPRHDLEARYELWVVVPRCRARRSDRTAPRTNGEYENAHRILEHVLVGVEAVARDDHRRVVVAVHLRDLLEQPLVASRVGG